MPRTKDYNLRVATENDIIDLIILGKQFVIESGNIKLLGWDSTKMYNFLANAISIEDFCVFVMCHDEEVVGLFVGLTTPCFFSSVIQSVEIAWYITPEHRKSKTAHKMIDLYEEWSVARGSVVTNLINLDMLSPDKVAKVYERKGYTLVENTFTKEL